MKQESNKITERPSSPVGASTLPEIPPKRYFTIGEVAKLCDVKTHVLRYWEVEFPQLKPVRRSNRRYFQRDDVLMVREISHLLYSKGYTIGGARQLLTKGGHIEESPLDGEVIGELIEEIDELCRLLK